MENKMYKKIASVIALLLLASSYIVAQETQTSNENWFQRHFEQRIYLGFYDSFGDEKANVLQAGYDAVLDLVNITPTWHLFEFNIGLNILFARDQINKKTVDNFGHIRQTENRLIPGFELNWGVRLYFPPFPKIRTSLYLEAVPITLVIYTKPYPDTGTHANVGTHIGFGIKSQINDALNGYATLRIFSHTSNGRPEATNPALDMVGLIVGLQF
jgi:hypothetical protein